MQGQKKVESKSVSQPSEELSYRIVEDLQACGINVSDIKKLQEAGLHTVGSENRRIFSY